MDSDCPCRRGRCRPNACLRVSQFFRYSSPIWSGSSLIGGSLIAATAAVRTFPSLSFRRPEKPHCRRQ
eukprot:6935467-Lingulodinium_polyedra.AAC.1